MGRGRDRGSTHNDQGAHIEQGTHNDQGAHIEQGLDGETWYCGRMLGRAAIPGSNGQCGPRDGPHCASCQRYQEMTSTTRPASSEARSLVVTVTRRLHGEGRAPPRQRAPREASGQWRDADTTPPPMHATTNRSALHSCRRPSLSARLPGLASIPFGRLSSAVRRPVRSFP